MVTPWQRSTLGDDPRARVSDDHHLVQSASFASLLQFYHCESCVYKLVRWFASRQAFFNQFASTYEVLINSIQNRWLLVELIPCSNDGPTYLPSEGLNSKIIWSALKDSVVSNFGDTGWGAVASSLTG